MPIIFSPTLIARYRADTGVYTDAGITPATDGSRVFQWSDLTGNGHHLTQTTSSSRPTYSSSTAWRSSARSSIFFNSTFLNLPSSIPFTNAGCAILLCTRGSGSSILSLGTSLSYGFNNTMGLTDSSFHAFPAQTYLPTLSPLVHGIRLGPNVQRLSTGNNQTSDLNYTLPTFSTTGGTLGQSFLGDLYELIIYSGRSDADLANDINTLQSYNGLTSHANIAQIIFIGDSNITTCPAIVCNEMGDAIKPLLLAQSTNTIVQQQALVNSQLTNLDLSPFDQTIAIVCAGTTDQTAGRSDSQIVTDLNTLCTTLRSLSMKVVLATIPNSALGGVNSLLRSNYATFADVLVDWAADSRLTDPINTVAANDGVKAALLQPIIQSPTSTIITTTTQPNLTYGNFYTGGPTFTGSFGHFVHS